MVGWLKLDVLLINYSPNMLMRRLSHAVGQQSNPGHPQKQYGQIKRPKRRRNKCRLFIHPQWRQGTFHQPTHCRYIVMLKYGIVWGWTHITCIIPLLIRAGGVTVLCLLTHWSNSHGRERCNHKWPLCIKILLKDYPIRLKKSMTCIVLSSYFRNKMTCEMYCFSKGVGSARAFGSLSSTKRQGACVEHQKWPNSLALEFVRSTPRTVQRGGVDGPCGNTFI
jgi:hypothetical protein